jgi:hypothetical protein
MMSLIVILFSLFIAILMLISSWRVYEKAGRQGWEGIIPVYNYFVLTQITGKPGWWILLMYLFPPAGIVLLIILHIELAKGFGKSTGFGIGLSFLGIIFYPMLAFSDATFKNNNYYTNPDIIDSDLT